jgi:hypothetical protein
MLNKAHLIKAAILSVVVSFISMIFNIFSAVRIHGYKDNIDWEAMDSMTYAKAMEYLEENSTTITGFEAVSEHFTEPVFWVDSFLSLMYSSLWVFVSFIALLSWVGRKKKPNEALNSTPNDGAN